MAINLEINLEDSLSSYQEAIIKQFERSIRKGFSSKGETTMHYPMKKEFARDKWLDGQISDMTICTAPEEPTKISIACEAAFNPDELADMVTRAQPFMYTKGAKPAGSGKGDKHSYYKDCVYVFVHQSLVHKAFAIGGLAGKIHDSVAIRISGFDPIFTQASCGNYYYEVSSIDKEIKDLKDFFRMVRSHQWPNKRKIDVECNFEEI